MPIFQKDAAVRWNSGGGHQATGVVRNVFTRPVKREDVEGDVKGDPKINRHASEDSPVYLVQRDNGSQYFKSELDLHPEGTELWTSQSLKFEMDLHDE